MWTRHTEPVLRKRIRLALFNASFSIFFLQRKENLNEKYNEGHSQNVQIAFRSSYV